MNTQKSIQELINFSIINIDKPTGPTSFAISNYVRIAFSLNKTSHFGTLDPQVTGVLPVALGRACRLSDYFMQKDKTYVGIMRLHTDVKKNILEEEIKNFIGKIKQLPPIRSRVKRAVREREIKSFEILEINGKDVLFKTKVQAGTYIRKLIHDIGKSLTGDLTTSDGNRTVGEKIGGAHMLELRRTQASIFSEDDSNFINLYDLDKAIEELKDGNEKPLRKILIPADEAITKVLPIVKLKSKNLKKLLTGKPLFKEDLAGKIPEEEKFAAFHDETFIGVYKLTHEKVFCARPEFVLN